MTGPEPCRDFLSVPIPRRRAVQIGALGAFGLTLPRLLARETASRAPARAKACILLHQFGGPSHLDTFDPKPDQPAEIRGPFGVIPTSVPGYRFSEHLPRLAKRFQKFALVRSVHHRTSAHNSAAYYSLTGHQPQIDLVTSNASATDTPAYGSVVSYLDGARRRQAAVPGFVSLPTMIADGPFRTPGEFAGFLGKAHDPLFVLGDPNSAAFSASNLQLPSDVDAGRATHREMMLREVEKWSRLSERSAAVQGMNAHQAKAMDILTSPETQRALEIRREPDRFRDRYGRFAYGQSVLLARRLVEAGVRFVTVYYSAGIGGWDTHIDNFNTLKNSRLPHTDLAVSALLDDLHDRGLLDSTLVMWWGEFGRTPKINATAGRDHWPQCYTVMMAGGGIRGGLAFGSSDATGAFPKESPVRPDDLSATLYSALGFSPETEIRDQLGRPFPISRGEPIRGLFA